MSLQSAPIVLVSYFPAAPVASPNGHPIQQDTEHWHANFASAIAIPAALSTKTLTSFTWFCFHTGQTVLYTGKALLHECVQDGVRAHRVGQGGGEALLQAREAGARDSGSVEGNFRREVQQVHGQHVQVGHGQGHRARQYGKVLHQDPIEYLAQQVMTSAIQLVPAPDMVLR